MRAVYMLHALNHVLKGRDMVLKNTLRQKRAALDVAVTGTSGKKKRNTKTVTKQASKRSGKLLLDDEEDIPRDQGFTRPKVLIVVPFRSTAYRLVELLIKLAPKLQTERVANKKRFYSEFGPAPVVDDETEATAAAEASQDKGRKRKPPTRPADWKETFAGNTDDCFTLGISVSRKTLKLYSAFYMSDFIIASPLGLRRLLATRLAEKQARKINIGDFDYLSSIEVAIFDSVDVCQMQNWEHMEIILEHLNVLPRNPPKSTDWARIRHWYLEGVSKLYRQTLLFSGHQTVEFQSVVNRYCTSHAGVFRIKPFHQPGSITNVVHRIKQVFQLIECDSPTSMAEKRFAFFRDSVLPRLQQSTQTRTLVFVPSYFDYVRVRNLYRQKSKDFVVSFCVLSEYSSNREVTHSRSTFFHGEKDFMLMTERFHFFRRYRIRGVHNIVFYGLPMFASFYSELLNMLPEADTNVLVLYTKFDALALNGVLGRDRARKVLTSDRSTHLFC